MRVSKEHNSTLKMEAAYLTEEYNKTVHWLFAGFKKAYDLVRREVLYNILIEFGVPMKLVRLIKICLNETYNKFHKCKNLSIVFLSKMV
jgi:hypothetical protein